MIGATRIPDKNEIRPDQWVVVYDNADASLRSTDPSNLILPRSAEVFLLPGTRREKLQAELWEALTEWRTAYEACRSLERIKTGKVRDLMRAQDAVAAAYDALAELDAKQEGEK